MAFSEPCISIPVQDSDELVLVSTSELPPEPEDLLDLLRGEYAPLHLWLDFAKAYLANGKVDAFLHILEVACGPEVEQHFADSKFERLQIHCAMAAFHLSRGQGAKDRTSKTEAFNTAMSHLTKATTIDINEQLPVLGMGQVAHAKGDKALAKSYFERAASMTCNGRKNVSGLLALADHTFQQEEYRKALTLYRRALKEHPKCPAEVRLGIAACNFRLGSFQKAMAGYQRALQLEPDSCEALLGLAVLSLNGPDADRGLREGMQMLCRAFNSNPLHPGVLNLLAHFSLLQGDLTKAKSLASTAFEAAETDLVKAQSMVSLARSSHSAGTAQEAFRFYSQALKLNPKSALPLLGLAQMNLLQKENTNAITLLENALRIQPGWNDALMLLGNLYPQMEGRKGQTALEHFRQAALQNTNSGQVLEVLGELLAVSDPAGSLAAYKKSIELYRKEKQARKLAKEKALKRANAKKASAANAAAASEPSNADAGLAGAQLMDRVSDVEGQSQVGVELAVAAVLEGGDQPPAEGDPPEDVFLPAKLLNNAAALHLRGGEKEAALDLMYEAIEAANAPKGMGLAASNQVTLGYNLARAKEANGNLTQAVKEYQAILAEFPEYLDCYFRLAWIARGRGNHAEALQWAEKALSAKEKDPNALALIAYLHMERREWKEAEDTFKELRAEAGNKNDSYCLVAQGAIALNSLSLRRKEEPEKVQKLLNIALSNFKMVLAEKDEHNLYAAHGAAAVLAEQATRTDPAKAEYLIHAKKVFDKVKDAAASVDPWLQAPDLQENLGHLALAEGRMEDALQFYGNVQRRSHKGTSADLLLYSARALYDEDSRRYSGGETGKASLLPQAKANLLKALHLEPSNHLLRFNLAIVMQEMAVRILKKERGQQDATKATEYAQAVSNLAMAHRNFFYLRQVQTKRASRALGIDDQKLEKHIVFCHDTHGRAQKLQMQADKEVAALEARRHQSRIELEAAMREKKALEEAEKRRAQRQAAERDAKAKQAQQRLQELQANWADNKQTADAVAEGDAMKADKRRKKQKQESAVDAIFGASDSDDGGDYDPDAEAAEGGGGDDEEEDEEGANGARGGGESRKRLLAGTGLESDEEEDDGLEDAEGAAPTPEGKASQNPSGRRLKRRKVDEGAEAEDGDDLDFQPQQDAGRSSHRDIFGESDSDNQQAAAEEGAEADSAAKLARKRAVDLFGESDDE